MQRLNILANHFEGNETTDQAAKKNSLSVLDNRTGKKTLRLISTGKSYELPIKDGAINATDLGKIKDAQGEVTRSYDPAYMNTVCCVSHLFILITFNADIKDLLH
jgi:hypothetical protein